MNKSIFCAALAAALLTATSCEKEETDYKLSGIISSGAICNITLAGTCNNLLVASYEPLSETVIVKTNVPCISYSDEDYVSGHGFQFVFEDKNQDPAKTGDVPYAFHSGGNSDYTLDCGFKLIQSIWNKEMTAFTEFWTDYTNYGIIETDVNFRVRGFKGERIINFDDDKSWNAANWYYLKGRVLSISEIIESTETFETLNIYGPLFKKYNYQPSSTTCTTQAVTLTVTSGEETVTVEVYGKKRDNELGKFLEIVDIGTAIEFPVRVKDKNDLKERKIQPVKTCTVLKLDSLDEKF